jgi:hypothetical protein
MFINENFLTINNLLSQDKLRTFKKNNKIEKATH